jgi:hypothetical protein
MCFAWYPAAGMSLFCTGWTFIWLLLLPFGIMPRDEDASALGSDPTWWAMLPISVMTAMMLGLEDLATQLEDPFKFIPYGEAAHTTPLVCPVLLNTEVGMPADLN